LEFITSSLVVLTVRDGGVASVEGTSTVTGA